jgi:2-polyprenyl-3-methyl-5-hydroxy-6-metoxy-1,4-benzoquinol methylase
MKCKICGNSKNNKLYEVKEMMFGFRDIFDYYECSECGCLQISEFPQNISKYYPSNYYSFQKLKSPNNLKKFLIKKRNCFFLNKSGILGYFLINIFPPPYLYSVIKECVNSNSRILDVGCGHAEFLKSLGDDGFKSLIGADPFIEEDISYPNGVEVVKKYISELDGKFDLILFNHSFEHIPDPNETMNSVYNLLSEEGICIIRIPTVSSFSWKQYNVNWVQLDAPRHLFLYSIDSIKLLASKSGLVLKKFFYDSTDFQFWGSEQYINDIPLISDNSYNVNPTKSIFSKKEIKLFKMKAEQLNSNKLGDQVTLYFAKM